MSYLRKPMDEEHLTRCVGEALRSGHSPEKDSGALFRHRARWILRHSAWPGWSRASPSKRNAEQLDSAVLLHNYSARHWRQAASRGENEPAVKPLGTLDKLTW